MFNIQWPEMLIKTHFPWIPRALMMPFIIPLNPSGNVLKLMSQITDMANFLMSSSGVRIETIYSLKTKSPKLVVRSMQVDTFMIESNNFLASPRLLAPISCPTRVHAAVSRPIVIM